MLDRRGAKRVLRQFGWNWCRTRFVPPTTTSAVLASVAPQLAAVVAERGAEVQAALDAAIVRGKAAWPALVVVDEDFVVAIARGVRDSDDVPSAISELAIADLYLAQACTSGAPAALAAFGATCDAVLTGSLRQMGLAPDVVEELVQEVRTKLFVALDGRPKIATYSGRATLPSWVRTVATRAAVDRLRKKDISSDQEDEVLEALPDAAPSPELAHFRETYRVELKAAFEEALATLDVRERNLLRHHFVDALTVEAIGTLYGVHKTTAFRWLEAARVALSKRTRSGFQQRVKAMPIELDSILTMLQSHIDLSLSRVLAS